MTLSPLIYTVGTVLILMGLLVPSPALIGSLRTIPEHLAEQLLTGATLFKISLIILGLAVFAVGRFFMWKRSSHDKESCCKPGDKFDFVILAIILVASCAMNLYRLGEGLWYDEIVTYVKYVAIPFGEIVTTYDNQNQHILYSVLAHAAVQIFGDSIWSLRLPAAVFGIGSVGALYLVGRQLSTSKEALLAAALLAFSYHHVWFSQNARGYTGLLFWTLLSTWFFIRALEEARPRLWVLYAACAALGAYTLIYMLFVILGHFAVYVATLLSRPKKVGSDKWMGLFLGFCLAGLLSFQLYALVLPQFFTAFAEAEVVGSAWTNPMWALLEFVRGVQANFSGSIVAIAAVAIFGAGFWSFWRTNPILIHLLVVPVIICIALKWGMAHHLWPRSLIFAVGFGALIVVRGTMLLGSAGNRLLNFPSMKSNLSGIALCAGLILVSSISVRFAYGPKQDYGSALQFVEAGKQPGDRIVTAGLASFPYRYLYKTNWEKAESLEALNAIRSRATRTWLIYTLPIQLRDTQPEIMSTIETDFKNVKKFYGTLADGAIFIQRSEPSRDVPKRYLYDKAENAPKSAR